MNFWIVFFAFFIIALSYRALYYYSKLEKIKTLHNLYKVDRDKFVEESQIALSLFKEAELKDGKVPIISESGFLIIIRSGEDVPRYEKKLISVFDNLNYYHGDFVPFVNEYFQRAKGVFRYRIKESKDPVFWIQFILQLPSNILNYLGLGDANLISKVLQIVYWALCIIKILSDLKVIDIPL